MSVTLLEKARLLQAIVADPDLPPTAKTVAVALVLNFYNGKTDRCFPSYESLAEAAGLRRRATAIEAIKILGDAGWLEIERRPRPGRSQTNTFGLRLDRVSKLEKGTDSGPFSDGKSTENVPFNSQKGTENARKGTISVPESLKNPPSPYGEGGDSPLSPHRPAGEVDGFIEAAFLEFWRQFPKKKNFKEAKTAYTHVVTTGEATVEVLNAGAMRYAAERDGEDPRYTKNPKTWLEGHCWMDEPTPSGAPSRQGHQNQSKPFDPIAYANRKLSQ